MHGGAGDNLLFGGGGHDLIKAGGGDDTLWGQGGDDSLRGGAGDDLINGGADTDRIWGQQGEDRLYGRGAGDALDGGPGRDRLSGDDGRDKLCARDGEADALDGGAGDDEAGEPIVRSLLDRAVRRLHQLCAGLLCRRYPRQTRPPLNLVPDELLSAVVERLLKALREARPRPRGGSSPVACQHIRRELNDMARRLDEQSRVAELCHAPPAPSAESGSGLTANACRILGANHELPQDEREAFDLMRIQGMAQSEVAQVLGVSTMTANRRLHRGLQQLTSVLADLYPDDVDDGDLNARAP